jgi:hypothetical protein
MNVHVKKKLTKWDFSFYMFDWIGVIDKTCR